MTSWSVLIPVVVGVLTLIGALFAVLTQRQRTKADERMAFLSSVLAEVQSLRTAEQLTDKRVSEIMEQLRLAQIAILDCYRERNELAVKVNSLEAKIEDLVRDEARRARNHGSTGTS